MLQPSEHAGMHAPDEEMPSLFETGRLGYFSASWHGGSPVFPVPLEVIESS